MPNLTISPRHNDQTPATSDIQKATAHTLPAGVNVSSDTPANRPAYTPSLWEKQYGYTRDSVFYRPSFGIYRNDEPLDLDSGFDIGYSYEVASHIIMHLKAVSNDNFTIEPLAWTPVFNHRLNDKGQA